MEAGRPQNRQRRPHVFGGSRISLRKELENEGFGNPGRPLRRH